MYFSIASPFEAKFSTRPAGSSPGIEGSKSPSNSESPPIQPEPWPATDSLYLSIILTVIRIPLELTFSVNELTNFLLTR